MNTKWSKIPNGQKQIMTKNSQIMTKTDTVWLTYKNQTQNDQQQIQNNTNQTKNCTKWPNRVKSLLSVEGGSTSVCVSKSIHDSWIRLLWLCHLNPTTRCSLTAPPRSRSPDRPRPQTHLFHQLAVRLPRYNVGTSHAAWCRLCSRDLTCACYLWASCN